MQPGTPRRPGDVRRPQGPDADDLSVTTGPIGARETSGVQVRLGAAGGSRARARAERRMRMERRNRSRVRGALIVTATAVGVAAMLVGGVLVISGYGDKGQGGGAAQPPAEAEGPAPRSGQAVAISTAEGAQYRVAAVTGGVSAGGDTTVQSSPLPSGSAVAYIDYVLSNPGDQKVLLDPPGDVFVKRSLVAPAARSRCMWQAGVPEDMCTPPTQSEVLRRVSGGRLEAGDGGDRYMPPNSSYLIRAVVEVPVDRRLRRTDLRLYIWQKRFVSGQYAQPAPFPG